MKVRAKKKKGRTSGRLAGGLLYDMTVNKADKYEIDYNTDLGPGHCDSNRLRFVVVAEVSRKS